MTESITPNDANQIFVAYLKRAETSFLTFIAGLIVPSGRGPKLINDVVAEHQMECFESMAPSLEALRLGVMPPCRRFWIERTKKASKDTDLAACLIWLLAFPNRPLFIQVAASDREQAGIVRRRIEDYLYYNPWLAERIELQAWKLQSKNKLVKVEIIASDIAGSHGETPDMLICNELSHVSKWEFIQNLLDNADGVPQGLVLIATNAGYKGTHAWNLKQVVETSDMWRCHYFRQPAPWHSAAFIEDAKRRNSPSRFNRLWKGVWSSNKGDAFDDSQVDNIFKPELEELHAPESGWYYIGGLDIGVNHDHAGFLILGVNTKLRRLRIATMRGFAPHPNTGEVNLMEVEDHCLMKARAFRLGWLGYDPHQAKLMAQRLRAKGIPMMEVPFTGNRINEMATALMGVLREGILESYEDPDNRLRNDVGRFNIVEKSYGYRLDAVRDESGHSDVGTALIICLPHAIALLEGRALMDGDVLIYDDDEAPEEMPEEFEQLFEAYEHDRKVHDAQKRLR